jgi:hypothetical protein
LRLRRTVRPAALVVLRRSVKPGAQFKPLRVVLYELLLRNSNKPALTRYFAGNSAIGILAASVGADRFARRRSQRWLIIAGFITTRPAPAKQPPMTAASTSGRLA